MVQGLFNHCGYGAGHPWFYYLGGPVLTPKEIRGEVRFSGYGGYLTDDIRTAGDKPEPHRSRALRALREDVLREFRADILRYREIARALHRHRKSAIAENANGACADIHMAISLKHNHLYNHFAHLLALEEALTHQRDLFDL